MVKPKKTELQHLTALASYDTLVLVLSSLEYVETLYMVPIQQYPIVCPLFRYLLYVSMCLSSWSVCVFTIERWVFPVPPTSSDSLRLPPGSWWSTTR